VSVPAPLLEKILENELRVSASYLNPVWGSASIALETAPVAGTRQSNAVLSKLWNALNFVVAESLWLLAGVAILFGLVRLGRRNVIHYSADVVGFTVAGLLMGAFLRFSGTLANFYSPSRAAIFVAIFVAAPVTMLLDEVVTLLNDRLGKVSLIAGVFVVGASSVWATGLGTLIFGGYPPGSLTANGVNAQDFTVSSSELATAVWIKGNVPARGIVQSDEYGQLVLTSVPGNYDLIDEIVPAEVDRGSYVYLSTPDLVNGITTVTSVDGTLYSTFKTTLSFFNQNFNVVYSTGTTRVYH
jgi:hypothetical protein